MSGRRGTRHRAHAMSVFHRFSRIAIRGRTARRGQSLVEFALVLPMLLVLLLGIADFARAFSAGVILEASARNGAEIGALERLRDKPPAPGDSAYYANLHRIAADAACD